MCSYPTSVLIGCGVFPRHLYIYVKLFAWGIGGGGWRGGVSLKVMQYSYSVQYKYKGKPFNIILTAHLIGHALPTYAARGLVRDFTPRSDWPLRR